MLALFEYLQNRLAEIRNEDGATAVEYGIMVALIAVAIVTAVGLVGDQLNTLFGTVVTALTP
jgi:pilus assembly protein Flp/PilA